MRRPAEAGGPDDAELHTTEPHGVVGRRELDLLLRGGRLFGAHARLPVRLGQGGVKYIAGDE